jgi:hypothetical protein
LLLIPAIYVYATDGVSGVEHPAKVNSVVTPDKVSGVSGLAAGAAFYDCSGDMKFGWAGEDTDVTADSPVGCSDGDSVATDSGGGSISGVQYYDGNESLLIPGADDVFEFDISAGDIFDENDGKIDGRVYITTWVEDSELFRVYIDANNWVAINMSGADSSNITIGFIYKHGGTVDWVSAGARSENEWIYFQARWKTGVAGNDMEMKVCDADGTSNCATDLDDDDIVDFGNPTLLRWGNKSALASAYYLDAMRIYGTSAF